VGNFYRIVVNDNMGSFIIIFETLNVHRPKPFNLQLPMVNTSDSIKLNMVYWYKAWKLSLVAWALTTITSIVMGRPYRRPIDQLRWHDLVLEFFLGYLFVVGLWYLGISTGLEVCMNYSPLSSHTNWLDGIWGVPHVLLHLVLPCHRGPLLCVVLTEVCRGFGVFHRALSSTPGDESNLNCLYVHPSVGSRKVLGIWQR